MSHKNKTYLKNCLYHCTEYFSWNSSFGSKRSYKRLINHISHADCIMSECSAVFLIPFIIYLTFSIGKKGSFYGLLSVEMQNFAKLKGFWYGRLKRIDPIILVQKIYLTMFTSSAPLSKQTQQEKVFKNTVHFKNLWATQNSQRNWAAYGAL